MIDEPSPTQSSRSRLSRRALIAGGSATGALLAILDPQMAALAETGEAEIGAASTPLVRSDQFTATLATILKGAEPLAERIKLSLPEIAENGNGVSFSIDVESPMTAQDHVKTLYLLSTANPQPLVATYHFSPINAKAHTTGRMRLAKTQDVVVVAELSNGELLIGESNVKVTIGGCGN